MLVLLLLLCVNAQNFTGELFTKAFLNGSYYSVAFPFGLLLKQYVFEGFDPLGAEPFVQIIGTARDLGPGLPQHSEDLDLDEISVIGRSASSIAALHGEQQTPRQEAVAVACATDNLLQLQLQEGILVNLEGRVGTVDRDHLFQFDTQQAHTTCGWSVNGYGELCLYGSTLFYQCYSGSSYKVYDAPISLRCLPVLLKVVEVVSCG